MICLRGLRGSEEGGTRVGPQQRRRQDAYGSGTHGGASGVSDARGGVLSRLSWDVTLPPLLPSLPLFLPISESVSIASSGSVIHLITPW